MSDLEFSVLDELYFVTSFDSLSESVPATEAELISTLTFLLDKKFIHQLIFDEAKKDYTKLEIYDRDVLKQTSFVASKEGLLLHNSRS